jgi:hypothetical protein
MGVKFPQILKKIGSKEGKQGYIISSGGIQPEPRIETAVTSGF